MQNKTIKEESPWHGSLKKLDEFKNDDIDYIQRIVLELNNENDIKNIDSRIGLNTSRKLANKELYWYDCDTALAWKKSKNKKSKETKDFYEENPIVYRFNNYGFRTDDDFNDKDVGIVTLGCSHTEGIGLHYRHTWAKKICSYFNQSHWNLGNHARGLDAQYRLLSVFSNYLKFDKVFLFTPSPYRTEFWIDDDEMMKLWTKGSADTYDGKVFSYRLLPNTEYNHLKWKAHTKFQHCLVHGSRAREYFRHSSLYRAIKNLVEETGAKIYILDQLLFSEFNHDYELVDENFFPFDECSNYSARDSHHHTRTHHLIYKTFLDVYNENK